MIYQTAKLSYIFNISNISPIQKTHPDANLTIRIRAKLEYLMLHCLFTVFRYLKH